MSTTGKGEFPQMQALSKKFIAMLELNDLSRVKFIRMKRELTIDFGNIKIKLGMYTS